MRFNPVTATNFSLKSEVIENKDSYYENYPYIDLIRERESISPIQIKIYFAENDGVLDNFRMFDDKKPNVLMLKTQKLIRF